MSDGVTINLPINVTSRLQQPVVSCGFATVEGAEMQMRVMKNLRMEKFESLIGANLCEGKLSDSTRLIVYELIDRGFNSIDQSKSLIDFLQRLTGWAVSSCKKEGWSSYGVERCKKDSPLLEEARCVARIMTSWKRTLEKKGSCH